MILQEDEALELDDSSKKRKRTSALDRILQVLDFLQNHDQPATAYEIARAVGAPLSTIYVVVEDLISKNILDRSADGTLWFGPRLYHYGLTYARKVDFLSISHHEMLNLATLTGETVQLCGRDGYDMVVLDMIDGPDHFQVASRIGTRTPLNWSASGRLLVGHLSEPERREIFTVASNPSPTGRAETNIDVLTSSSRVAFDEKLSIQAGESDYFVACVASPIVDRNGVCIATISIVVPDHKVSQQNPSLTKMVQDSAQAIMMRLGS